MLKSVELKQQKQELLNSIRSLQSENKIDEAYAKLTDLQAINNQIELAEALEAEDRQGGANPSPVGGAPSNLSLGAQMNRAFNKAVFGWALTAEEEGMVTKDVSIVAQNSVGTPGQVGATPNKGGYLLREEQMTELVKFRRGLTALKKYCHIRKVTARSGSEPAYEEGNGKLTAFDELDNIAEGDRTFTQINWLIKDYGEIVPISNTLLEDIDLNLVALIGETFERKAVCTENGKILEIALALSPVEGTTAADIIKAMNTNLNTAHKRMAKIFTNQNGFNFLDQLTDKNGASLMYESLTEPGKYVFKGREVVELDNTELPDQVGAIPFFVGDMDSFIRFYDREQVAIALSTEAGFKQNATLLRTIERFDVQKADEKAMVYLKITPDTALAAMMANTKATPAKTEAPAPAQAETPAPAKK